MTVCRFFQQGNCRFGPNCRYDHIYGSKYSYHANPQQQSTATQASIPADEQLVTQVQADMQSALLGGQWILSCYSPFKERPTFPGITELSPEEARLFIYEAKNSNNLEKAITYMNNVINEAKQKYEKLQQPDINIIKVLRGLYKGEVLPSPFATPQGTFSSVSNNTASSIFRSAVQNTHTASQNTAASIFSQAQQSIFNTQPDPAKDLFSRANNTNIFGSCSPTNTFGESNQNVSAKSVFANAVQNTANQFNQPSPSNIFATANQSIFGSPPNQNNAPFALVSSNSPFSQEQSQSPFAPTQNTSPFGQGNVFQKTESPASIFGQANKQLNVASDPGVYSKIEDLSEADLEAFKSDKFELGFVPELPPPHQLCTRAL